MLATDAAFCDDDLIRPTAVLDPWINIHCIHTHTHPPHTDTDTKTHAHTEDWYEVWANQVVHACVLKLVVVVVVIVVIGEGRDRG